MALTYRNRVEYALISQSRGRVVIPEPINFDDGSGNIYERDKESKGFLNLKSNKLEFHNEGYDFITSQLGNKGIAEDVVLEKRAKSDDRLDERWRTFPQTFMDMGECSFKDDRTVSTKATQGGIRKVIDSRQGDDFDIVSTEGMSGDDIGVLKTVNVELDPRDIFLRSVLSVEQDKLVSNIVTGGDNLNARAIPFQVDVNSDSENIQSVFGQDLNAANNEFAAVKAENQGNVFYYISERDRIIRINGKVKFTIDNTHLHAGTCELYLVTYDGGAALNFKTKKLLASLNPNQANAFVDYDFVDEDVTILEGESVAIATLSDTSDGIYYYVQDTEIEITEDSTFSRSNCRAVTPYDMGERLVAAMTGQADSFRSSFLEEGGAHAMKLLTNGFWVRQFPDIVKEGTEEERRIQFQTSWKDFLDHLELLEPIAWWVEVEGNKEVVRVESLKSTQQDFVGVRYGNTTNEKFAYIQASKIKRKVLKKNFYSKIVIGSSEGGDGYEEIFGLQSISGRATYSTINTNNESTYERLTPYALGDIDVEIPRRKPFVDYADTDTKYDETIICLDCKKDSFNYSLKKWQDSFESAPKNIYRPDSAFNLEFSPARLLLNHGFVINVGLYHYPQESMYFSSSNCNSSYSSKMVGEDELKEGSAIPNARLEPPRIRPKSVDFNLKVSQELEDAITGIMADGTPNWHGLVAVDTGQVIEYMRIILVDTNKEGKHKLVEANI